MCLYFSACESLRKIFVSIFKNSSIWTFFSDNAKKHFLLILVFAQKNVNRRFSSKFY